jgi:hypothetical protein
LGEFITGRQLMLPILILTNPFCCLRSIDERFIGGHEPIVTEEEFIEVGARFIREQGAEAYLRELLENLKGNFVDNTDDPTFAYRKR